MTNPSYIISLDQGTSSCRALLVDQAGHQIAVAQKEFNQYYPNPGWVEHDPIEIWETQMQVLNDLIQSNTISASQIAAIGITNQRETTVVWNKHTGKPVYNAIVWQDKRTIEYCKSLKANGIEKYTKENMGLPIDPYFSGTKIRWLLEQTDEDLNDLLFGTIDTWLIWKMTNGQSHVTDYTNASRTLLYNIILKCWDNKMCDVLGVPHHMLPVVQDSASHFGNFEYQGTSIPITGVAGDQQAALFGQGCVEVGMAKNTYGTGCFMLMNIGDTFIQSDHGLLTTLCCNASGKPVYALEGSIFMAGASVQWLRDGLGIVKSSDETEALASTVSESYKVIVVPSFAGLGAPYWSMDSKGSIFGLTRDTTKAHLAKATLDAICYRTKDVLEAMEKDSGKPLKVLRVDGGACKNNYMMQFQADMLNVTVERPMNVETTALGVAYLAGIHVGFWNTFEKGTTNTVDKIFTPHINDELRTKLYNRWSKAISATIEFGA